MEKSNCFRNQESGIRNREAMRIITGKHKGRKIELGSEGGKTIRPTSDFARQAIFNILQHSFNNAVHDAAVLDCFSGTGAMGLEALSRGASCVAFIDQSRDALNICRRNVENFKETEACKFILADVSKLGAASGKYNLIFIDPPYFSKLIEPTLACLHKGGWLEKSALIILEHDEKEIVSLPAEYEKLDERRYGRAVIEVIRYVHVETLDIKG